MNAGQVPVALNGIRFVQTSYNAVSEGVEFTFGAQVLAAGERTVVVRNREAFESRYGTGRNIAGQYGGKLSNAGERIALVDASGTTIESFAYDSLTPWPPRAPAKVRAWSAWTWRPVRGPQRTGKPVLTGAVRRQRPALNLWRGWWSTKSWPMLSRAKRTRSSC